MDPLRHYAAVWAVDFEFTARTGGQPRPLCVVARELRTARTERVWLDGANMLTAPYGPAANELFVAYYASAELGCHLALGWPMPARILDLCAEFKRLTSGLVVPCGRGLLGAGVPRAAGCERCRERGAADAGHAGRAIHGSGAVSAARLLRERRGRPGPAAAGNATPARLAATLLRGRYMAAAARMEWAGVPLDADALARLRDAWDKIKGRLIDALDPDGEIYAPAGIDAATTGGAAILETADQWGIAPHQLAGAVGNLWEQDREIIADTVAAIRAARQHTGLTAARCGRWEDAGHDYSTWPGLDVNARELAGMYPALGIGPGYVADQTRRP